MGCNKDCGKGCPGHISPAAVNAAVGKKKESVVQMVAVLTLTCFVAGLALAFTYNKTKARIAEAELASQLSSVKKVLPAFEGAPEVKELDIDGCMQTFYVGKKDGRVVGVATRAESVGYGGTVAMLVGVDPSGAISGMALLAHQETPGLGAKAGSNDFLNQFKGKVLADSAAAIRVTKDGGDIDAITAATITSRTVADAATKALRIFLKHKDVILG